MPASSPRPSRLPVVVLLIAAAVAGTFQLRSTDFFWHLVAGRWILTQRAIPDHDPFRYTSEVAGGAPWVDHEWGFQVLLALLEKLGGIPALELARSTLVTCLAALLLAALRRSGTPLPAAVLVVLAAVLGARERFLLRPELASLAGITALLALLGWLRRTSAERLPLPWKPTLAAVALTALWANLHPGVLAAPILAGLFVLGTRLPGGSGRREQRAVPWSGIVLLPLLLSGSILINPAGAEIFAVPGAIGASLRDLPGFNPEWQPLWKAPRPALLLGAAALAALAVAAWTRARRLDPATGLTTLALAALAVASVRHQGLFFLGAASFAGHCLADLAPETHGERATPAGSPPRRRLSVAALAVAACLLAVVWCVWPPSAGPLAPRRPYPFGLGLQPGRFPQVGATTLAAWPELSRTFHDGVYGGYLLWRYYPPRQVFIDGRNEVNPELLRELAAARTDSRRWRALLDRYRIDSALVRYDERPVPVTSVASSGVDYRTIHSLLFPRQEFALVYFDDLVMFLVRRGAADPARIAAREYRVLDPEDWRSTLAVAANDPALRETLAEELERRLGEEPRSRRAEALAKALAGAE